MFKSNLEPAAYEWIMGAEDSPLLLLCDHASGQIPTDLNQLGLAMEVRFSHIVWDIGASELTRQLALRLKCPALFGGVSRLVVDLNRHAKDDAVIPTVSNQVPIPANKDLTSAEKTERLEHWYYPYHQQIETYLNNHPHCRMVLALHSFTPKIAPESPRPWHIGILWHQDKRLAQSLLSSLYTDTSLVVGDNQPYSGYDLNHTLDDHILRRGLLHVAIEIRQDLLCSPTSIRLWTDKLHDIIRPLL